MSPRPVSRSRPTLTWLLSLPLVLTGLGGCYKVATDSTGYAPYKGGAPLTIRGVWPGQSGAELVSHLGKPERRDPAGHGAETLQWERASGMAVTLDTSTGRVTEVLGDLLTGGGDPVIEAGMPEAAVRQVLGKPARDQDYYRPSGSGIISLGRTLAGRSLWYRRDGRLIEISVQKDRVAYVRLLVSPP